MAVDTAPAPAARAGDQTRRARRVIALRPGVWLVWALVVFFFVVLLGVIASVVVDSFGTSWFGGWLPNGFTAHWYPDAWSGFDIAQVLWVTAQVALIVVAVSAVIGVPTAYALARRDFPGKRLVLLLFVLPILVPPMAYGIPLATVLYKYHLAGRLIGVIIANLVPAVPFVVFTMVPFIEQIDPRLEAAARMCGAPTRVVFTRVLTPLLLPGVLAASILVLVRTFGMFELTFLTSGPTSQTLIVDLYSQVFSAGITAPQSIDVMAVIYTGSMMVLLLIALRFINPTQLVTRTPDTSER
jgi:putative spermidine/putrescine transport system permease protein